MIKKILSWCRKVWQQVVAEAKEANKNPSYDGTNDPFPIDAETVRAEIENESVKVLTGQHILENPERYGTAQARTRQQLANLVLDYGHKNACKWLNISEAQLRKRLIGTFSEQLKEKQRQQRLANK